jgi:hypothetical protein
MAFDRSARYSRSFVGFWLRALMAAGATVAVVGVASAGLLFSTARESVSLVFEPLSLMLMPGMLFGMYQAGPHDLEPKVILWASFGFYFAFFFALLEWRAWSRRRRRG